MSRLLRINAPNITFHVINRGNGKNNVFFTDDDYRDFLYLIKKYKEKFPIRFFHYVLMSNHVHFLVEPLAEGVLSKFIQCLTISHTRRSNTRHGTVGHLWQGRFKSIPIETDAYLLQCGRYIELNPVRAGTVSHPSFYPWSSYHFYASGEDDGITERNSLYEERERDLVGWRNRYLRAIEEEIATIKEGRAIRFSEQQVYGSDAFVERLKSVHGCTFLRANVGRPRKEAVA